MKKLLVSIVLVIFAMIVYPTNTLADELSDVMVKYSLTGEKLDQFEQEEQMRSARRAFTLSDPSADLKEYNSLIEQGLLSEEVDFEDYRQFLNTPEPIDPVIPEARNVAGSPMAGDILVTNATSSNGLTGHAGIFLADGNILSIEGYGQKPTVRGIFSWMQNTKKLAPNSWTKVYRPNSTFYRNLAAGKWGNDNIRDKNYSYGFSGNRFDLNPTYCSKIVMQCYYFANKKGEHMVIPSIISPYALPNLFMKGSSHIVTWK
ncbi:CHAP domain-containing protein [Candidatus Enterococcus ikei]|nr:CHAP domain-containing protein [Enterococcus sp. DIV0869a]